MKRLKSIAGMLAGVLILGEIIRVLDYLYVSEDSAQIWSRNMLHSFYKEENIDNVFLGTSHVYCDINPYLLDELNQQSNFNLSSPGQLMNGSYYLLREADRKNQLSHVYIELYYRYNVNAPDDGGEPIKIKYIYNWYNTDYMEFSLNKLSFMSTMTDIETYPETWFRFIRYRADLSDWGKVADNISRKKSEEYLNYNYHLSSSEEDDEWESEHREKGYWYMTKKLKDTARIFRQDIILQENPVAGLSEEYLRKTITYCQEHNIPVTLFISPIYELQLISTENYDNYIDQVRGIAKEYHVDFYDFNLVREDYLSIQKTEYFQDLNHLNSFGADLFTDFFEQVVSGDANTNRRYFYDSYKEKLRNQEPEVFGIYFRDRKDMENDEVIGRDMRIASNRESEMEYRITLILYDQDEKDDTEQELIQDFSENKVFEIEAGRTGTLSIEYRLKTDPDFIQAVEIGI